jgi:hypothetical protein
VRLPATFVIRQGGIVVPGVISAPASVAISLTVVSGDGRGHTVRVRGARGPALLVPVGGRASAVLSGLKAGTYQVIVDGVRRATLVVGVAPGP